MSAISGTDFLDNRALITDAPPVYELHGLRIRSEVALGMCVHESGPPDLTVRLGDSVSIPDEPPVGRVLAAASFGAAPGYTLTETQDGYTLRFHRICEFWIDDQRRSIRVDLDPSAAPGIAQLMLAGNVVALLLMLAGECVLHASAVEVGGSALAFVGSSGMGKSTLAALFCASGACLVTDDLLRLEPDGHGFRCFRGTAEIRLRPSAAILVEQLPGAVAQSTADGRLAVRLGRDRSFMPLPRVRAVVIPRPSRTCQALCLKRLTRPEALFNLMSYPRVIGWQASEPMRRQFQTFARVAKSVPVFEAEIPWGPPFAPELPSALVQGVGFDCELAKTPG